MRWRRWAIRVAAGLAVPLGLVLALLAVDVLRVPRDIAADDVRFQAAPRIDALSGTAPASCPGRQVSGCSAPATTSPRARRSRSSPSSTPRGCSPAPEQEAVRGRAQLEVTLRARDGGEAFLHSRHLNLLGVLTMARYSTSGRESDQYISRALGAFQAAIEVDPTNLDAKKNLEILLRRPEAVTIPPNDPLQGGAQGRFSGRGRAGSGS